MSDHIPDHVLVNVLLRLPFDSLIRSRCVSKSWRSLIDDPHFIKMHYLNKNHLQTNYHHDDTKIIALVEHGASVFTRPESIKFYTLDSDLSCSSILHAKQLNCPIELSEYHVRLAGSCNGLLCLLASESDIFLWNPIRGLKSTVNYPLLLMKI
ncbi:unnamed protein product [Coffea canephora]|uniref:F-box domain-containing protein n=1 Tax=Coffea canephora TaxID=49390 RepID=A0A068VBA0_COFCA|nr:unnamed protein product [Coffea canephora]